MPELADDAEAPKTFAVREVRERRANMSDAEAKPFASNFKVNPDILAGIGRLRRQTANFVERFAEMVRPLVEAAQRITEDLRPALEVLARELPGLLNASYLPNWVGVTFPDDLELLEHILIDEGIALA